MSRAWRNPWLPLAAFLILGSTWLWGYSGEDDYPRGLGGHLWAAGASLFTGVFFLIGYRWGQWRAIALSAILYLAVVIAAGFIEEAFQSPAADPRASVVVFVFFLPVVCLFVGLGVAARRRSRRT